MTQGGPVASGDVLPQSQLTPREYLPRTSVGWKIVGFLGAGIIIIIIGLLSLVLDLAVSDSHTSFAPGIFGGISVAAVFSIGYGVFLLRTPTRVITDEEGLTIEGRLSRRQIAWGQIASLGRDQVRVGWGNAGDPHDVLTLRDANGQTIAKIQDVFLDYGSLVNEIESRSSAARGGVATYDPNSDRQRKIDAQRKKAKRMAVLCGVMVLIGLAIVIGGAYLFVHERRLARDGVVTDATIVQRHMFRVTPYVEYSFTDKSGQTHTRDAMVEKQTYDALDGATIVPIRYIPSDPEWNTLVSGEPSEHPTWLLIVLGCAFTALFASFLVAMALGVSEITIKNGKLRMIRFGQLEEDFDEPTGAATAHATALPIDIAPPRVMTPPPSPVQMPQAGGVPSGIRTIAILNIVFGTLGVLFDGGKLLLMLLLSGRQLDLGPRTLVIHPPLGLLIWIGVDLLLAALLIASAVGLFKLRSWGRTLALVVAALQVLSTLGNITMSIHDFANRPELTDTHERTAELVGAVGGVILLLLTAVYPVIVLIVLGRRSAAQTFRERTP